VNSTEGILAFAVASRNGTIPRRLKKLCRNRSNFQLTNNSQLGQNIHPRRFPQKQQHLRRRDLGCVKKPQDFCAHATRQIRRNEWAQYTPRSAATKRSGRLAVCVAQESAEPLVTLGDGTSQCKTTTGSLVS